ncbi:MAG: ABC transporter ATP-binding protein [uncultured bacterium]|nr:MAG: ABC transporter ATP-binding protein [uncultured bacterium]
MKFKAFNKRQYEVLAERYYECLFGNLTSLLWMIGQAPIIALLIVLRWKTLQPTESLYFVISLSAVWFGCINSCGEIAKEKSILKREKLFGINMFSYLLSKVKILSIIGLIETGLFTFILNNQIDLDVNLISFYFPLFGLYFSGMAMGLFISRWCGSVVNAIITVPVMIIPQIVFSKFVLPLDTLKGISVQIEKIMIVKWGFEAIKYSCISKMVFGDYLYSLFFLILIGIVFLILTLIHLCFVED